MIPAALLACALNVAPVTLEAVIGVESGGNPLALNVNGLAGPQPRAGTAEEAATLARQYIAAGYSVDIGLMQINSRNLPALGATVEQVVDPCTNIRSGATILTADYVQASQRFAPGQPALQAALSAYNTGTFARGFENGYVARYLRPRSHPEHRRHHVPRQPLRRSCGALRRAPAAAINVYTADISVYQREATNVPIPMILVETVSRNLGDLTSPGVVVEVDAEQAEQLGAFEEDALTPEDAWAASVEPRDGEGKPVPESFNIIARTSGPTRAAAWPQRSPLAAVLAGRKPVHADEPGQRKTVSRRQRHQLGDRSNRPCLPRQPMADRRTGDQARRAPSRKANSAPSSECWQVLIHRWRPDGEAGEAKDLQLHGLQRTVDRRPARA